MRHSISPRSLAPVGALVLALVLAGCSTSRFGGRELAQSAPPPQPLPASPSGNVQSGSLPPAVASGPGNIQPVPQGQNDPNAIGTDPNAPNPNTFDPTAPGTQVAAADPVAQQSAQQSASALPVTENSLVGNWTASVGGSSCSAFFGLTNLGSGLLGGTRGCSGTISKFRTWNVGGKSATLNDASGTQVASLRRTGEKTFSGTTASGEQITLTR